MQQQPATAIRNKASSTNIGSATKFANNGPVFSQSHTQFKSSNQTSHSKITGRTMGSHANHSSSITSMTPIAKNISQEKGRVVDKSSGSNRIQFKSTCENADVEKALYVDSVHMVSSEMKCRTHFREDDFDTLRKYTNIDKNLLTGSSSEDNKNMVAVNEKPELQPKGLTVKTYRHYAPATRRLDFQGLLEDLGSAPSGSVVFLQACAHNPAGVDPTLEQWEQIRQLIRSKSLLPFFDSAYQGFASGSLDADAHPIRLFIADGGELLAAQSYTKNMGLYGECVGALNIVSKSADDCKQG